MLDSKPKLDATTSGTVGALKAAAEGSKLKKNHSAAELRAILAMLKLHLMDGRTDLEIQENILMCTTHQYNEFKKELYRQESAALVKKTTEDVFLEYQWAQQKCIDDLGVMVRSLADTKQHNAIVGAIRARSEILDKILQTGQSMGVISKEPERKLVVHGHLIAKMSNVELRKAIAGEMSGLASAIGKYGDTDMDGNQLEAGAPTFSPQGKTGLSMAGPVKAAAARASRQSVKRAKVIDVG